MNGHDHVSIYFKVAGAIIGVLVYVFSTFATKSEINETLNKRMDRIENKLDQVILGR